MARSTLAGILSLVALLPVGGCSSSSATPRATNASGEADGGGTKTESAAFETCDAACRATTLHGTFGAKTVAFDRGAYGVSKDGTLHVEAYDGGDPGCPAMHSASPRHTVIVSGLSFPAGGAAVTKNVTASLLDFTGDLTTRPALPGSHVSVKPRAAKADAFVALAVDAGFEGGSVTGSLYAEHCASLDE